MLESHEEPRRLDALHDLARDDLARDREPGGPELEAGPLLPESETELELVLRVRDPEVVDELGGFASIRERDRFAEAALRIGVLALRTARGRVDVQAVRGEVERMLGELRRGLDQHRGHLQVEVEKTLRDYFDPESGRFSERVSALTHDDGELAQVIRRHVEGSDSALAQTLARHVGSESPLLRMLDPSSAAGLPALIQGLVEQTLSSQRERILSEFSLDNSQGSLARLVGELKQSHGALGEDLKSRIADVVKEFSLDQEDSALSRLVHRVERAQQQITEEFTLDSETSALARLRRELMEHTQQQSEQIAGLEKRMATELASLASRRAAEAESPAHGNLFERELLGWLEEACRRRGDLFHDTSNRTGLIKHCKVGDAVVELGPEHQVAGARIVVEAKEEAAFRESKALEEIEQARKNRGADVGIFVLSARSAGEGWRPFRPLGSSILVCWDAEDPVSDAYLDAALTLARALCVRSRAEDASSFDHEAHERAVREVAKQLEGLDSIRKAAETIESGTGKIKDRVRILRGNLERAVQTLERCGEAARSELGGA